MTKVRKHLIILLSGFAIAAAATAFFLSSGDVEATGRVIYADYCAVCHGANLEGQPNWQTPPPNGRMPAPPHDETGHTWHHGDEALFAITKFGLGSIVRGIESDMPGFRGVLTDYEINAVLAFIKSTWSENERAYQDLQTANQ